MKAPPCTAPSSPLKAYAENPDADLPGVRMSEPSRDRPTSTRSLRAAVLEIEAHAAEAGWDQPARLYALVPTADLVVARAGAGRRDGPRRARLPRAR